MEEGNERKIYGGRKLRNKIVGMKNIWMRKDNIIELWKEENRNTERQNHQ